MRPISNLRRPAAFSLLEVLLALVIFATVAVVLGSSYLNVLSSYAAVGRSTGSDLDVAFAREGLLTQADLPTAKNGDEYDTDDGKHVKWSAQVSPTSTADLFSVDFTCTVSSSAPDVPTRTTTQTFMLLRPTWSDPADRAALRQAAAARIAQVQGKASS